MKASSERGKGGKRGRLKKGEGGGIRGSWKRGV